MSLIVLLSLSVIRRTVIEKNCAQIVLLKSMLCAVTMATLVTTIFFRIICEILSRHKIPPILKCIAQVLWKILFSSSVSPCIRRVHDTQHLFFFFFFGSRLTPQYFRLIFFNCLYSSYVSFGEKKNQIGRVVFELISIN